MAITNAQQYQQLVNPPMKGKKRPGYRGDDAARSDAASGRDAGRADPSGGVERGSGRDPSKQYETKTNLTKEAEDALKAQRKEARYQITPSTRPRNRLIAGALGLVTPFGLGRLAFNTAINRTAMGFNTPTTTTDDNDDDTNTGGDGDNFRETMIAQQFSPYQQDLVKDEVEELSPIALALQQRDLAGGARAFAKEGGIMDFETNRQMYGLGKLVKKITRGVKKIVKSPIGAAAVASFIPFGPKGDKTTLFRKFMDTGIGEGIGSFFSDMDTKDKFALAAAAGLTAAPLLLQEDDTEDEYQKFLSQRGASGQGLDIQGIRNDPYSYLGRAFVAEGGKPEPVAKKTLPLLDMGGQEMDLRAEGGFVPIGRMEKADDVPARLSKNEFVFTADAVRNAGEGDVDKGAEVMYNMMKNLESGGEVSEESQGLDGARRMFQTSQRLEEVL